jgi:sigma-B regulation protein RsbU (phosphoserine phosphatase)
MRSLVAVPLFDKGTALNMVVLMRQAPAAFRREALPEHVWMANLFGRATHNLALSEELRLAYEVVDRELRAVADIQRSLLPAEFPVIPGLQLAAFYQTSTRAGGDYYDFFPLPNGQWGILIADVSGHGTAAAVLMAVTHTIAHTAADPKPPPSRLLRFVSDRLAAQYTTSGNFVTAFYAVYDPPTRRLVFSNAGHPPPRVRRSGGRIEAIGGALGLPLGIELGEPYADAETTLEPGDTLLLYTDGITEARSPACEFFGFDGLDDVLRRCDGPAPDTIAAVLAAVDAFAAGAAATDDRTLVAATVV